MLTNLHWLGHASFRLDASRIVYFDPWKLPKDSRKAEIIFISHGHFDHFSKDDVALLSTKETVIVTDESVGKQLEGKLVCKEIKALKPGDTLEVLGVKVQAVSSYNLNKEFHPKADGKLGFIVTIDEISIYHSGDTDYIPEMKDYACDIALLPVSGTYVMTADEAANAALTIKPKAAIPMHYGDIVGSNSDAERFRDLLKGKIEVRILKKEK
jgi:L-ascorbate metabolism protein UlaG (beta-lactamase superfamily)